MDVFNKETQDFVDKQTRRYNDWIFRNRRHLENCNKCVEGINKYLATIQDETQRTEIADSLFFKQQI